jgi:hypothetical protein
MDDDSKPSDLFWIDLAIGVAVLVLLVVMTW